MKKRRYVQTERAAQHEETHERILQAIIALHQELGPARTSISAIAKRAGVQRLTIYRHFPDDETIFRSCTQRWLQDNPPPAGDAWSAEADPMAQCETMILAIAKYYRRTQAMWSAAYRDAPLVPALKEPMAAFSGYLDGLAKDMVQHLRPSPTNRQRVSLTIRHCIAFTTWSDFATSLTDSAYRALCMAWIQAVLK